VSDEDDRSEDRVIRDESEEADRSMVVDPHDDRTLEFERTGLSRMRTTWRPEDAEALAGIHQIVDNELLVHFAGAYQVMNEIWDIVREPVVLTGGEVQTDVNGWTVWARNELGDYIEDYSKLSHKDVEHFLFKITTRLFEWEQASARLWGDSMSAKALWEMALARGYRDARTSGARTVEDRIQAARLASEDDRFFGIFQTTLSRHADAIVRSTQLLGQRLKDVLSV
jgi:hypothetical protein